MSTIPDLKELAIDRSKSVRSRRPRRRHLVARYVVPTVVLAGFATMLAWAARDRFLPAKPVTVLPVVVTRAVVQQGGARLFKAPGWIEPRPTPVFVSALTAGVIEELLVVEGQDVRAGEPVARLLDVDARLALDQALADLALRRAELANAQAELVAARQHLQHPVHLEAALAEAESRLAKTETEMASIPLLVQAAESRVKFARQNLEGKQAAGSSIAARRIQQAQSEHAGALAELAELRARQPRLKREAEAVRRQKDALGKQLDLLIDETRRVAGAEAQVQAAEARERQAQLAVEAARLQLDRMVVRAPIDGRVLSLIGRPGTRLTGLSSVSHQDSPNVLSVYDPKMLQVRADVRLEDVPLVQSGQLVRIETVVARGTIDGEVLSATSRANIQKNTLEVKVAIKDPPATIRPEMLVQVTFLAPQTSGHGSEASQPPERLLVPRQLVEQTPEGAFVWRADAAGTARRQRVVLGQAGTDELIEVTEGLNVADKLISGGREGLRDGERIKITAEDPTIGVSVSRIRRANRSGNSITQTAHGTK